MVRMATVPDTMPTITTSPTLMITYRLLLFYYETKSISSDMMVMNAATIVTGPVVFLAICYN